MEQTRITFVINGKTFSLRASDGEGIGAMPAPERQQLIDLLEAVKQHESRAREVAQRALDKAALTGGAAAGAARDYRPAGGERLGSGDVDALMARLVAEDNRKRNPGPTRQDLYKWVLGIGVVFILLVLIL
jgi:hypothetical protein